MIYKKKLGVKNIHDLIDKEIKGKFKTNNLTDEQIKKYKRYGSELIDGKKFVYAHESIIIPVIMHCRTPESCKFKRSLGFKLHNVINCKEQTVLQSIKDAFEEENMQTQYGVLGYKIDLYFHEYKLAIEVDELGHNDRNIDYEIQRHTNTNLVVCLLELILMKRSLTLLKPYDTLKNQLKNL